MKTACRLFLLILVFFLFACVGVYNTGKFVPDDVDQYARDFIETVRWGDLDEAIIALDPSVAGSASKRQLEKLRLYMNPGDLVSTELINGGINRFLPFKSDDRSVRDRYFAEYYVQYQSIPGIYTGGMDIPEPDAEGVYHQLINLNIEKKGGEKTVLGIHVNYLPASPARMNAFNLEKKPFWMMLFLIGTAAVPVFILYTVWLCVRSSVKRRWLWILFIMAGFGKLTLNWTTGQLFIKVLSVQIAGAGFYTMGPYSPWLFSVSVPLGAIFFHLHKAGWGDVGSGTHATGSSGQAE